MRSEDFEIKPHYHLNCSGFVNHLLVTERHFEALREIRQYVLKENDRTCYRDTYYPRALTFVRFMKSNREKKYWTSIQNVKQIEPGDIIAYAKDLDKVTNTGQHIMIVSKAEISSENWVNISVFDSTIGHGLNDYRGDEGGLGEGIISIEMDKSGTPRNLKWSLDSKPFEAAIVIARLR